MPYTKSELTFMSRMATGMGIAVVATIALLGWKLGTALSVPAFIILARWVFPFIYAWRRERHAGRVWR